MVLVVFGDIVAKAGRFAVSKALLSIKEKFRPDFIIGNVENLSGARGINKKSIQEMMELGFSGFTSGNHIWDNKEVYEIMANQSVPLIRPLNYPSVSEIQCPGVGYRVLQRNDKKLLILNLMGRVFMDPVDCPFQAIENFLKTQEFNLPILVDMHADATSEKYAMGFSLDGRVTAVVGTHSHVQTADERLLPKGTAYITDLGMSGSFDSCIGMTKEEIITRYRTKRHIRAEPSELNPGVSFAVIKVRNNFLAESIERFRYTI